MLWNCLPLIEMDDYQRKGSEGNSRFQGRDGGEHLEMDIGRQLSQLREQSRTSRDDYGSNVDAFGRDTRRPYLGNGDGGERAQGERDGERYRRMEGNNSPREWSRRERDADRGFGDHERDRSRDRNRDWGRDEQRRRPRDYGDRGEYSDGSEGSLDGARDDDRERYRDHRRDRTWDSDRFRGRRDRDYRDRDDRDWRRDRWEDRDDNRKRDYRDRRRSDENGQWSDNYRSRDRYHDDRDYHRREYHYEEPSEVVILKGLPSSVEDSQIHDLLGEANLAYKDIRVVKNREGLSRGFAFVEFLDVDTAKGWIDSCQGKLQLDDCGVFMDFSRSKTVMEAHKDWICSKCGTQNFSSKRRNACFCCNAPKDENDEQKDIGQTPCKVLILRGLDTLTTEETSTKLANEKLLVSCAYSVSGHLVEYVFKIRHSLSSFTTLSIFDVRLIKDKMTGTSRGFCFIELGSTEEATKLLEEMQKAFFKIDEKLVTVSYARFGTQPPKPGAIGQSGANSSTITSSSASSSTNEAAVTSSSSSANQGWPKNNFAANAIAQAHAAAKMGNTTDPIASQIPATSPQYGAQAAVPTGPTAPIPGFPQDPTVTPTVQPPPALPATVPPPTGAPPTPDQVSTTATPSVPPSALSSYVYDAATGYYYDTTTGLYYDPNTQYYYNPTTQQYMYWDAATQQYVAVVSTSNPTPAISASVDVNPTTAAVPTEGDALALSKEKQKKAKSLSAKKIAKDMERWAKKLNVNKETRPQTTQAAQEATNESTYQYDPNEPKKTGVKMSFVGSSNMSSLSLTSSSPLAALSELDDASAEATAPAVASSLVAEYGGEDSGGEDDSKEETFTDWTKIACLLCKRQFPTKDALTRHNQFSELHKQNLQVQKKLKMSFVQIDDYERQQREAKYRDRAKERRELFGQPDSTPSPSVKKRKQKHGKVAYEQPTKDGITSDNIGNKMLQAMGWTQGTGLGKDRQGIVDPISAKMRNRSAGLGMQGSDYGAMAGDSERDMLKKMAQSRYEAPE